MPLNIIATDDNQSLPKKSITKATKRTTAKAKLDRLYLTEPDQFNPLIDAIGRERVKRTTDLIKQFLTGNERCAADLGTGTGIFAKSLSELGIKVDAVDIATVPLKALVEKNLDNITVFQDYIPHTTLDSDFYDLVLGLDVIAYLNRDEFRLFFAETSRLVNLEGLVIISTPLGIDSEDALQNFLELVVLEFDIKKCVLSHHGLFIRLLRFFEAPATFVKASSDKTFFNQELYKRFSINQALFKFNTSKLPSFFWSFIKLFSNPILQFLKQNRFLLIQAEKICRFFSYETSASHAIIVGKRRKLFEPEDVIQDIILPRKKERIWE